MNLIYYYKRKNLKAQRKFYEMKTIVDKRKRFFFGGG